jgi:hypothetical protein
MTSLLTLFLKVVERSSAVLGIDKEIFLQRDTNHTDLCRFRDAEDFEHIGLHIRRLARDAQKKMPEVSEIKPLSPRGMLVISQHASLLLIYVLIFNKFRSQISSRTDLPTTPRRIRRGSSRQRH